MNVAITGSNGFVGKNLSAYLNDSLLIKKISRTELDTINSCTLNNCGAVIHLAGKAHDLKTAAEPEEYYAVNFELTKKLYHSFLESNAEKFIFISSVKAAADQVDSILTENHKPNPQTHYGKSKLMAEEYIQAQLLPKGKSFYILRPCMVHGPGNKGNLNLLYQIVKKGLPYPLAGFDNKRSFLSVDNLCFVIKELISQNDIPSGIYQVSDDQPLSTNEVVSILASSLDKDPKLWKIPTGLINALAQIGDLLHLPLTTERLGKLTENYIVSNEKLKKVLNEELPLTSINGLKITADSFNANNIEA